MHGLNQTPFRTPGQTKVMKRLLPLLALGVASCASAGAVILGPGQTGELGDGKITVMRVQDSRCPQGVMCIQAGELKVSVLYSMKGSSKLLKLTFPAAVNTPWQGVRIVSASPKTVRPSALKITFTDIPVK